MTYAPLCYTCMTLLHCPTLADINGHDYVRVCVPNSSEYIGSDVLYFRGGI